MQGFYRLAEGVIVLPLMNSIMTQPELWDKDKARTTFEGTAHAQVHDILLRFGKMDGDDLIAADRPEMQRIAGAKMMALNIMNLVSGSQLGRVIITKLEPGKKILPHADVKGAYAAFYSRYCVVLQGLPGSLYRVADETVNMRTGEVWWADVSKEHEVMNNSSDDRIHMLIDLRLDK